MQVASTGTTRVLGGNLFLLHGHGLLRVLALGFTRGVAATGSLSMSAMSIIFDVDFLVWLSGGGYKHSERMQVEIVREHLQEWSINPGMVYMQDNEHGDSTHQDDVLAVDNILQYS